MIAPGVFAAFLLGLVMAATFVFWADRRAVRREAEFWEQLSLQALDGYGRVFDWEQECREFGCHDDEEPA